MKPRLATSKDEDLIRKIHKQNSKELGSFNLFYSWDKYLEGKSPYKFYVIEDKAFMRFGYSKQKKLYTIKEIGVLDEYKGQGLAKIFFFGIPKPLYLTCNTDNQTGNAFYKKMGMKLLKEIPTKNGERMMNVWIF